MTNAIQTTSAEASFRAVAADRMVTAANMTLHELLDEFQRLAGIISDECLPIDPDNDFHMKRYTEAGKVAINEINLINGAVQARFGIRFMACSLHDEF